MAKRIEHRSGSAQDSCAGCGWRHIVEGEIFYCVQSCPVLQHTESSQFHNDDSKGKTPLNDFTRNCHGTSLHKVCYI